MFWIRHEELESEIQLVQSESRVSFPKVFTFIMLPQVFTFIMLLHRESLLHRSLSQECLVHFQGMTSRFFMLI